MKLTTLLLIFSLIQVSAATLGQQITLRAKNISLENVLKQISQQSGYGIYCDDKAISLGQKIDVNLDQNTVEQALNVILKDLGLTYEINDQVISISKSKTGLLDRIRQILASVDVHGMVVDEKGQPVPGATVKLKDNSQATVTDAKGEFMFKRVNEDAILVISFVGYKPKEIKASGHLEKIQLEVSTSGLDEVKVIAYGQTTQRYDLGNVVSVTEKDIEKQNVTNPLLALQGRVPGLSVIQATGYPNGGIAVRIQGQNSLANGSDPFYVVDGVPYPATVNLANGGVTGGMNPLSLINPADIESISVLKDADATAIYGSQAANGAIVITTKKGRTGPAHVEVSLNQGGNLPSAQMPMMNTSQYLAMRREAYANAGKKIPANAYDLNGVWDTTRNTNWQKLLVGNVQNFTNANLSISGGTAGVHYNIGGTYTRTNIPLPAASHFSDQRGALHFNLGTASENQKFKIELNGNYLYDLNKLPSYETTNRAVLMPPDAPPIYSPDGSLNWALDANGNSTWFTGNPLANLLNINNISSRNLLSNLQFSYKLTSGLTASLSSGFTDMTINEYSASPLAAIEPNQRPYNYNYSYFGNTNNNSWNVDPLLEYKAAYQKHDLTVLAGGTFRRNNLNQTSYNGSDYPTDATMSDIALAQYIYFNNPTSTIYQYTALFGRLNYRYNNEFLFDVNWRRDGSSRYGADSKFHSFYALGGGWIFTEENFVRDNLSFLSFGKLRFNYGTTGSDQIGEYSYLSLYNPVNPGVPYASLNGLQQGSLSNPYLHWEETRKLDFGIDLGFLKDRILLGANYYRNRSSSEIVNQALPSITGFFAINQNFNALVQNSGFELTLTAKNIQKANFTWTSSFNFGENRNKLVSFNGLDQSIYGGQFFVGSSLSTRLLYNYAGVNPTTGLYQFKAKDGTLTSTPSYPEDAYIMRDMAPLFSGGIGNAFRYHEFSLDFFFQFVKQFGPNWQRGVAAPGYNHLNQPVNVLSHWQKPGDISEVQRFDVRSDASNSWTSMMNSNGGVTDASYLRLKNISLSWHVLSNKIFKDIQLTGQAQNIFTLSRYLGDPETLNYHSLSGLRTFTLGLKLIL